MGFICGRPSDPRITHDEYSNYKKSFFTKKTTKKKKLESSFRTEGTEK